VQWRAEGRGARANVPRAEFFESKSQSFVTELPAHESQIQDECELVRGSHINNCPRGLQPIPFYLPYVD
jgi:hypothetical protein